MLRERVRQMVVRALFREGEPRVALEEGGWAERFETLAALAAEAKRGYQEDTLTLQARILELEEEVRECADHTEPFGLSRDDVATLINKANGLDAAQARIQELEEQVAEHADESDTVTSLLSKWERVQAALGLGSDADVADVIEIIELQARGIRAAHEAIKEQAGVIDAGQDANERQAKALDAAIDRLVELENENVRLLRSACSEPEAPRGDASGPHPEPDNIPLSERT